MTFSEPYGSDRLVRVGKVPFTSTTIEDATRRVIELAREAVPVSVRLSNAYCVALASQDEEYASLLSNGGINFPDGAPVVWTMRWRSRRSGTSAGRVRGPSLFRTATAATVQDGLTNFLFGTTEETLALLTTQLNSDVPGLKIAGTYAPPFGPIDELFYENACQTIQRSGADLVWVALGTPKQDFVSDELARRTGVPCVAVGAAFDFVAGTADEAPKWIQSSGFEWLYRLCKEPKRLWRRYLYGNVRFIYSALLESGAR